MNFLRGKSLLVLGITMLVSGLTPLGAALFYLFATGDHAPTSATPLVPTQTLTRVLDAAAAGTLARAELTRDNYLLVTYAPTGDDRAAPSGYGQVLLPAGLAPQVVDRLVAAHVPVQAVATTHPVPPAPVTDAMPRAWILAMPFGAVLGGFGAATLSEYANRRRVGSGAGAPAAAPACGTCAPTTRFTDVAGCEEAIADLSELVAFLRNPEAFAATGAKAPKGALLVGPPGTGKTLLARAVAGEAGVPFFTATGSDFVEMYVGMGAKRVRDLFAKARKHERAIIFIDEIDAVARRRSSGHADGGDREADQTLNALLTQMDGFAASNVIVLAATNRPEILDEAITRPGRLDRRIEVPHPDRRGREQILAVHAAGKPLADDVDLTAIARRTPGFSGAQLAALVNEACTDAARRGQTTVDQDCFDHAVATIAMGRARTSAVVTEHDRQVTAWHEAGHTLAAYLQDAADDPVQVTIVPRGPAGGVTWMSGNDDQFLTRRKAHAQLVTALAGRAAEEILLDGEYTQGAHGDLTSATNLARAMTTQYGMTRLGYQIRDGAPTAEVTEVVEELLVGAHTAAADLLASHRDFLAAVATALLEEETLTLADVETIARRSGVARHATPLAPPVPVLTPRPAAPAPAGPVASQPLVPARGHRPPVRVVRRARQLAAAATSLRVLAAARQD